jgi:hypothetical protein
MASVPGCPNERVRNASLTGLTVDALRCHEKAERSLSEY